MDDERRVRRLLSFEGGQTLARLSKALYSGGVRPTKSPEEREASGGRGINRTRSYDAPAEINALGVSPEHKLVALTGKDFLNIVDLVSDISPAENSSSQKSQKAKLLYSARPEKSAQPSALQWGTQSTSGVVALATVNGSVYLYTAGMDGVKPSARVSTTWGAIGSLSFSSGAGAGGNLLLGAASDGAVRLWDLRQGLRKTVSSFARAGDIARETQFRPDKEFKFATIYDSGITFRWDIRKPQLPDMRINAHMQGLTLNWHPTQNYLLTGGRDHLVQVWNMNSEARTPAHTFSTPAAVAKARWVPGDPEVASSAIVTTGRTGYYSSGAAYWSLRRPHMPSFMLDSHTDNVTDVAAVSPTLIWTVGRDKLFVQNDLRFEQSLWNTVPPAVGALSSKNEMAFDFQATSIPRSAPTGPSDSNSKIGEASSAASLSPYGCQNDTTFPFPAEDSLVRTLNKVGLNFNPTPIISSEVPSAAVEAEEYLAKHYLFYLPKSTTVADCCRYNAQVAHNALKLRTAQSWRLLAAAMEEFEDTFVESLPSKLQEYAREWLKDEVVPAPRETPFEVPVDSGNASRPVAIRPTRVSFSNRDEYEWNKPDQNSWKLSGVSFNSENSAIDSEGTGSPAQSRAFGSSLSSRNSSVNLSSRFSGRSLSHRAFSHSRDSGDVLLASSFSKRRLSIVSAQRSITEDDFTFISHRFEEFVSADTCGFHVTSLLKNAIDHTLEHGNHLTATALMMLFHRHVGVVIGENDRDEIVMSCIHLMRSLGCFVAAAHLMALSSASLLDVHIDNVSVDTVCHYCRHSLSGNASFLTNDDASVGYWYCSNCRRLLDGCNYCNTPVKGLADVLLECGHKTHPHCWETWVVELGMRECPAGCGQKIRY